MYKKINAKVRQLYDGEMIVSFKVSGLKRNRQKEEERRESILKQMGGLTDRLKNQV